MCPLLLRFCIGRSTAVLVNLEGRVAERKEDADGHLRFWGWNSLGLVLLNVKTTLKGKRDEGRRWWCRKRSVKRGEEERRGGGGGNNGLQLAQLAQLAVSLCISNRQRPVRQTDASVICLLSTPSVHPSFYVRQPPHLYHIETQSITASVRGTTFLFLRRF